MDAIKSFFTKYHAAPASDAGPRWDQASDAALIGWASGDIEMWDRPNAESVRAELLPRMKAVGNEMWARMHKDGDDPHIPFTFETGGVPTVARQFCTLWNRIFYRIGFQHATSDMPKRG